MLCRFSMYCYIEWFLHKQRSGEKYDSFYIYIFIYFRNYNGPQRTSPDHKGSSQKNYNRAPYSPGYEFETNHTKYIADRSAKTRTYADGDDSEVGGEYERNFQVQSPVYPGNCVYILIELFQAEFRRPRDVLLSLVTEFFNKSTARLIELNKKFPQDGKPIEILELRSQIVSTQLTNTLMYL